MPEPSVIVVQELETAVVELSTPGPQGPPGTGGGGGGGLVPTQLLDIDGLVHYAGQAHRIVRADFSTSPSTRSAAAVADLASAWPNRKTLIYTPL